MYNHLKALNDNQTCHWWIIKQSNSDWWL